MKPQRPTTYLLLLVLAGAGVYYAWDKRAKWWPSRPPAEAVAATAPEGWKDRVAEARRKDYEELRESLREKAPAPEVNPLDQIPDDDLVPLTREQAKWLDAAPDLSAASPPILFPAPLQALPNVTRRSNILIETFLYQALSLTGEPPQRLSLIAPRAVSLPYMRTRDRERYRVVPPDQFVSDASRIGADICVGGSAGEVGGILRAELTLIDLRTNRMATVRAERPRTEVAALIAELRRRIAEFAGVAPDQFTTSRMDKMLPGPATYELLLANETPDADALRAALAKEPHSYPLLEHAITVLSAAESEEAVLKVAREHPNDDRTLYLRFAQLRAAERHPAALIHYSEILRRRPAHAHLVSLIGHEIDFSMVNSLPFGHDEKFIIALTKLAEAQIARYPKHWHLQWSLGYFLVYTAHRLSPEGPQGLFVALFQPADERQAGSRREQGLRHVDAALQLRPDTARLNYLAADTRQALERDFASEIEPLLNRIEEIDPEFLWHDITRARHYLNTDDARIVRALDRVRASEDDPDVVLAAMRLLERYLLKTYHDAAARDFVPKRAVGTPAAERFRALFEAAFRRKEMRLYSSNVNLYSRLHFAMGNHDWGVAWEYTTATYYEARAAHNSEDWALCYTRAREIVYLPTPADMRHNLYYFVVKSLWKMKRYREAFDWCERAIRVYPDRHTFHYLFAVIARESGTRLHQAHEHALTALALDPTNESLLNIYRRLATTLKKPIERKYR